MSQHPYVKRTIDALTPHLVGQKIASIAYIDGASCEEMGWDASTIVITLENGVQFFPSQDDEGNGPGALFTSLDGPLDTIGTVPL